MKTVLICPDEVLAVRSLTRNAPPAAINILGKPLIVYWIEYLVGLGATQIVILSSDRPQKIREIVHDGYPWGINIELLPQRNQLSVTEAQEQFLPKSETALAHPYNVVEVNSLPGGSSINLFESFENFFTGVRCWIPHATKNRVNMKEVRPGVWISTRSRISPAAVIKAPCWIGDNVRISEGAVLGPMSIVEENVAIGVDAMIANSIVQTNTYVGDLTNVQDSIATGNILINWKNNSSVAIPDPFLIGVLKKSDHASTVGIFSRATALAVGIVTLPFVLPSAIVSLVRGTAFLNKSIAVLGNPTGYANYYELNNSKGYFARWPQLWNIVRGEFEWFGNRPLSIREGAEMNPDFENLWLKNPPGIFSQADSVGCWNNTSDEAAGHACFYSAQSSWKLKLSILKGVLGNWYRYRREIEWIQEGGNFRERWFALRRLVSNFLSL